MDLASAIGAPKITPNSVISGLAGGLTYAAVATATTSLPPVAVALGVFASFATGLEMSTPINIYKTDLIHLCRYKVGEEPAYRAKPTIGLGSALFTYCIFYNPATLLAQKVMLSAIIFGGYLYLNPNSVTQKYLRPILATSLFAAALLAASNVALITLPKVVIIAQLPLGAAAVAAIVTSLAIAQLQGENPFRDTTPRPAPTTTSGPVPPAQQHTVTIEEVE